MRMNYCMAGAYTLHMPRNLLKTVDNINSPVLPLISNGAGDKHDWIYNIIKEHKSVVPALKWIYNTDDKEEFNIGTHQLVLDDSDRFFTCFLKYSPTGSRFWFFKLKSNDEFLKEYHNAIEDITNGDWIKIKRLQNKSLGDLSDLEMVELANTRLEKVAERYGAIDPWKPFTLNDYSNNGDMTETSLMYKLYTKP